jgi:hypothetical protein
MSTDIDPLLLLISHIGRTVIDEIFEDTLSELTSLFESASEESLKKDLSHRYDAKKAEAVVKSLINAKVFLIQGENSSAKSLVVSACKYLKLNLLHSTSPVILHEVPPLQQAAAETNPPVGPSVAGNQNSSDSPSFEAEASVATGDEFMDQKWMDILCRSCQNTEILDRKYGKNEYTVDKNHALSKYPKESLVVETLGKNKKRSWELVEVLKSQDHLICFLEDSQDNSNQVSRNSSRGSTQNPNIPAQDYDRICFVTECRFAHPRRGTLGLNQKASCCGLGMYRVYRNGYVFCYRQLVVDNFGVKSSKHACEQSQDKKICLLDGMPSYCQVMVDGVKLRGFSPAAIFEKLKNRIGEGIFTLAQVQDRTSSFTKRQKIPENFDQVMQMIDKKAFDSSFHAREGVDDDRVIGAYTVFGDRSLGTLITTPGFYKDLNNMESLHYDATHDCDKQGTVVMAFQGSDAEGRWSPGAWYSCKAEDEDNIKNFLKLLLTTIADRLPESYRPQKVTITEGGRTRVVYRFAELKYIVCDGLSYFSKIFVQFFGSGIIRIMC